MIRRHLKDKNIRIGIYIIIIVNGPILFEITYKWYCKGQLLRTDLTFFLATTRDFFQITFFIVMITITILSYLHAKKSLFTPIKTEIFKMQIKSFEEILAFFQSQTETDFTQKFDFDFMVSANFKIMFTDYINTFFKDEININYDSLNEIYKKFAGGMVTISYANKNFHSPAYYEKIKPKKVQNITNPALILEKWRTYEYGNIHFSKVYSCEIDKLTKLIASPLVPHQLKLKMINFESKVRDNLTFIGKLLTKLSQELPTQFPSAKSINNLEMNGIWNKFNKGKKDLEPDAKDILNYIRHYLKIETLIE